MRRITPRQEALLAAVSGAFPGVNVHWDEERGVASSLRGALVIGTIADADAVFRKFLDEYGELFGPPDLTSHLHPLRDRSDDIGWRHLEYHMTHPAPKGSANPGEALEVWGEGSLLAATAGDESEVNETTAQSDALIELAADEYLERPEMRMSQGGRWPRLTLTF